MTFTVIDMQTGEPADLSRSGQIVDEEWANGLYGKLDGFAIEQDGSLLLMDTSGNYRCPPEGRFTVVINP